MYLNPSRRRRFSLAALLGMLVWLFVVAQHVHLGDTDEGHPTAKSHACLVCALAQPAAGPAALPAIERREFVVAVAAALAVSLFHHQSLASYLSRGPPRI